MPTKAKSSKHKKAPAAKKQPSRKSAPKADVDLLAKKLQAIGRRLSAVENRAQVPGPAGEPGPQGPPGPKGDPADPSRLEELERRVAELESRLATSVKTE
jgi:uncharacterized coiled-coil protein SlyX